MPVYVKRSAKVGEKIVITNAIFPNSSIRDGNIYTVKKLLSPPFFDEGDVDVEEEGLYVDFWEYKVIEADQNEIPDRN